MVVLYYSTNGYVCQYEGNNIHVNPAPNPTPRIFRLTTYGHSTMRQDAVLRWVGSQKGAREKGSGNIYGFCGSSY